MTFGCFFFDYDLDGLPDIFAANGHVSDDIERVQSRVTYAQRPHLFRNLGKKQFEDARPQAGPALQQALVARGAAYADYDNDGDLDILITVNNGRARLFRNDGGNGNRMLRVRTVGTASNRDGIGAQIEVFADGKHQQRERVGSIGYLSCDDPRVHFGLGAAAKADKVVVTWPSGTKQTLENVAADKVVTIEEK